MKLKDFSYTLPSELIATHPVHPRDSSKMLVVDGMNLYDKSIQDFHDYLEEGDVVCFNNSKVIPALLIGKRGEAKISINLSKNLGNNIWEAFAKPKKRLKIGDVLVFAEDFCAEVHADIPDSGIIHIKFLVEQKDFMNLLYKYGKMPLPQYMKRIGLSSDNQDYQTVFAEKEGSVAAPTAGLHFTEELLNKIRSKGVKTVFVTLHVGAGTFLPVITENILDHKMHKEYCEIPQETADIINNAKKNGNKIIAVGTTSVRTLESNLDDKGYVLSFSGETGIFITPGYKIRSVDLLLTNFHLPESSLIMLVSAFSGLENIMNAYNYAIKNNYRFYSYGDACLLHPLKD